MWNHSVNNCRGMLFTLLSRIGLCSCINKLSFKHNRKSFCAPPITRKLSGVALQLLQLMWFKTAVLNHINCNNCKATPDKFRVIGGAQNDFLSCDK